MIESSRIFDFRNVSISDYANLRGRLVDVRDEIQKFGNLLNERGMSIILKINESIPKLNNAGGGARSRSKRGKCQYGKNKITKHRRIRSKNNKMKRKNKITKKIINNRKR